MKPDSSMSLGLEDDNGDDDFAEAEEQALRLTQLPCGTLLAFGGDDGTITAHIMDSSKKSSSAGDCHKFATVQRYDEGVRAVAVSSDGLRIAVGFDSGSTQIYEYKTEQWSAAAAVDGSQVHPFVQCALASEDNEDDVGLMSQDCSALVNTRNNKFFVGPEMGLPIRDLHFLESTAAADNEEEYWLAIASESGAVLVNVSSSETLDQREMEQEVQEHHDQGGIRGIAATGDDDSNIMATLAMDGRLCLWNLTTRKLLHRESKVTVPKKDMGEIHGADAWDRSCRSPVFLTTQPGSNHPGSKKNEDLMLLTPGQVLPVVRCCPRDAMGGLGEWSDWKPITISTQKDTDDDDVQEQQGHMEAIVCLKQVDESHWMTSGRDKRLILWKVLSADENADKSVDAVSWKPIHQIELESGATDLHVVHNDKDQTKTMYAACSKGTCVTVNLSKLLRGGTSSASTSSSKSDMVVEEEGDKGTPTKTKKDDLASSDVTETNNESAPKDNSTENTKKDDGDDSDIDFSDDQASSKKPRVRFVDDEADEDSDDDSVRKKKTEESGNTEPVALGPYGGIPEDDSGVNDSATDRSAIDFDQGEDDDDDDDQLPRYDSLQPLIKPQAAFAPSSTPLDLTRRFLCWNHMGAVTLMQGDDRNTVDIHFTDSAFRRPISFTDNMQFIVASLGEDGGIFASDLHADGDDDDMGLDNLNMSERTKDAVKRSHKKRQDGKHTGSSIFFYRFETFGSVRDKDWYLTLPDGELVLGSACGEGWAAVMTSRRFLRFFSSGGNQKQLVWLPGEPVSMAGKGRYMAVFYHQSAPLPDNTQQLAYQLWDAYETKLVSKGPLACVSRGSSLTWVGFSNDNSLMAMDSDGMVSMLTHCGASGWEWSPMLDTIGLRKSNDDRFWPITAVDGKLVCVPLKGGNSYPDATRRPVTSTLQFRHPLAKSSVIKNSALEELSVRSNIALDQKKAIQEIEGDGEDEEFEQEYHRMSAQVDKVTLKLFMATVEAGKLERALDLVERLHLEKSFELALRMADRHHKLADLIEEVKERRFADDDDGSMSHHDSEMDDDMESPPENSFIDRISSSSQQISPDSFHQKISKRNGESHRDLNVVKKRRVMS